MQSRTPKTNAGCGMRDAEFRRPGEGRNPGLWAARKAFFEKSIFRHLKTWMPACAGIMGLLVLNLMSPLSAALMDVNTPEDEILSKAFAAYMDGRDKRALSYFEEVVRLNPKNRAAERGLRKVKVRLRKKDDVEKAKRRELAIAKYKEGRGLNRTHDQVAAIDAFHAALDATPEFKPALRELKKIRVRAEKKLKRKKFSPSEWGFIRGVLAYLERDWAKAYRLWSERLKIDPGNVTLANATQRAEKNFRRMMVSEREDFFRRSARAFYQQGLYRQSKKSWQSVLAMREDDLEALEGMARSENALLRAKGKGRDDRVRDLLEEGLEYYANQSWKKAREVFITLTQLDPDFQTARDYVAKLNKKLSEATYIPVAPSKARSWKPVRPSNEGNTPIEVPEGMENLNERITELESQRKRDPSNIRVQQELDKLKMSRHQEAERVYKDGLIAYSQGNRGLAIDKWKQVLVINPGHKKAAAALKKARAEEERLKGQEAR